MDPDFDSEAEYNSEVDSNEEPQEDSSDVEYDDGKMSDEDVLNAEESESDGDLADEEGELELSEMSDGEEPAEVEEVKKPSGADDDYIWEKEDGDAADSKTPTTATKKSEKKEEEPEYFDRYRMDPLLVRRESTLVLLCLKAFKQRVIIFFNEKKQCGRVHSLFAFFGLKAVEVHGDLSQE